MQKTILKLLMASLLGSICYLIIGWLIFDFLLGAYTEAHTTQIVGFKKEADFSLIWLYLSCLAYSSLLTFVLHHTSISSGKKSFFFSAILGVLVACMTDFYWLASSYFYSNLTVVLIDIIGAAVSVGLTGWIVFGLLKNKSASINN
jgi:hypothetical protein